MTAKLSNLSIRTDPETLGRWKAAAERDRRPLAQWVRIVLDEASVVPDVERYRVSGETVQERQSSTRASLEAHKASIRRGAAAEVQPMFKASKVKP